MKGPESAEKFVESGALILNIEGGENFEKINEVLKEIEDSLPFYCTSLNVNKLAIRTDSAEMSKEIIDALNKAGISVTDAELQDGTVTWREIGSAGYEEDNVLGEQKVLKKII